MRLSISIVSHQQIHLVKNLLADISLHKGALSIEVLLTLNLPEALPFSEIDFPYPLRVLRNAEPFGFGENHNRALAEARGQYFCVLNPDIRIHQDTFGMLVEILEGTSSVGLIAPKVFDSNGNVEDSARYFPSVSELVGKIFGGESKRCELPSGGLVYPDWVAGMFMLLPTSVFRDIGGFDPRYFLYYEDVDLCARLTLAGYRIALCQDAAVVHEAQRASHRNLRYMRWHLASALRFFLSKGYRGLAHK